MYSYTIYIKYINSISISAITNAYSWIFKYADRKITSALLHDLTTQNTSMFSLCVHIYVT